MRYILQLKQTLKRWFWLLASLLPFGAQAHTVTITISIPPSTPQGEQIYIAGNFNQWNPSDTAYRLTKNGAEFSLTFTTQLKKIEYKFTRGSWSKVEGTPSGKPVQNRILSLHDADTTLTEIVEGWEDAQSSVGTRAVNVEIMSDAFPMPQLGRTRRIWVYLPPDYAQSAKRYPVLYVQDGQNLFDASTAFAGEWAIDETLNALHANGDYGVIVVGIDNGGMNRLNEYSPWEQPPGGGEGERYGQFIVETLKPAIDKRYRTKPEREYTAVGGSSMGGLITHYLALKYQNIFSKAMIFSPAYWFAPEFFSLPREIGKQADNMKFYILAGEKESASLLPQVRAMRDALEDAGFRPENINMVSRPDGEHSEWFWKREFADAYRWLFGI